MIGAVFGLLLFSGPVARAAMAISDDLEAAEFEAWCVKFGKTYPDMDAVAAARANWHATAAVIDAHNQRDLSWKKGHTQYSDLSDA